MRRTLSILGLLALLALAFAARCWNLRDVFVEGRIYFIEADAYSRMTRAQMVASGESVVIRHHAFENFPSGTTPHTTAPLDWLIMGGKWTMDLGFAVFDRGKTSVLRAQTLDLAGALVSPLLGVLTCAWLWWWSRRHAPRGLAWTVPLLFALSPILVHGTLLGRPDHQSLLLLLLALALAAEVSLASGPSRAWSLLAGSTWALALWVSLYEPLVLIAVVLVLWLIADRRRFTAREVRPGWIAFAAIVLTSLLLDGWRVALPDAAMRAAFATWQQTIGELAHLDVLSSTPYRWLGAACVLAPMLLAFGAWRDRFKNPQAAILCLLLVALALSIWQLRWGYFLALIYAISLPWQLAVVRWRWLAGGVFAAGLWTVAQDWEATLYPDAATEDARAVRLMEGVQLRELAALMRSEERAGFLAPWWLSPAISYWSGQPGVAGSSHEALTGTLATARFFLAPGPDKAESIARGLGVRWVLTDGFDQDGTSRLVKAYAPLLDGQIPPEPWGPTMHDRGRPRERVSAGDLADASPELRARLLALADRAEAQDIGSPAFTCVAQTQFYKLFRVKEPAPTP